MGIAWNFESDDFDLLLSRQTSEAVEERLARDLADRARELGSASVEGIPIDASLENPDGRLHIDEQWVRNRAEELLRGF